MMEFTKGLRTIWIDTATKQKRDIAIIGMSNAPVELIALTAGLLAFCIDKKKVEVFFIIVNRL